MTAAMPACNGLSAASRRETVRAVTVAVIAVLGVLWPLGRSLREDSFPLSNYPMFTHDPDRVASFPRAIGLTRDGREVRLSPELTGGTVEVIHAAQTLTRAVNRGESAELCDEIAERVSRADLGVDQVVVVTDRYDLVSGLRADHPRPVARVEHVRCPVGPA
jgi:hypothetical protein